jgi:phosphoglycolate phosphatase
MTDQLPILLFDLDGTLVDTAPDLVATLNTILAKHDRAPMTLESVKKLTGDGARALLERGFEATGAPANDLDALMADFINIYVAASTVHSRPYDGAVDALEGFAAAGYRMAVCTNKPQAPSETILHELDLMRFFDTVVGGDRFPVRKPDAQHLLGALELMDATNHPAIMVGDSYNDVASARNAGMPVIVVSYGYTTIPPVDLGGDILVDFFAEIPDAVNRLRS